MIASRYLETRGKRAGSGETLCERATLPLELRGLDLTPGDDSRAEMAGSAQQVERRRSGRVEPEGVVDGRADERRHIVDARHANHAPERDG